MAINLIKNIQNRTSINCLRHLSPLIASKRCLSSDLMPTDMKKKVELFDKEYKQDIKEKVLDRVTHTGQRFAEDDYRLARFVDKQKEINPRFAIDLIAEVPPIATKDRWASCDGGGGPLGHPKVFINLDDPGEYGTCGYCGLRFYKEGHNH